MVSLFVLLGGYPAPNDVRAKMILETTAVPFTKSHRGGGESFPWYLSEQLGKLEPTILAYAQEPGTPSPPPNHLALPGCFLNVPPAMTTSNPLPTPETVRVARAFIEAHVKELDFIHVHNLRTAMTTMWLSLAHRGQRKSKIRILLTDHGSRWFPFPSLTASWVDFLLPVSSASWDQLRAYTQKPARILPVGVPPDYPGLQKPRKLYGEREVDVIFFGRLIAYKRIDLFLRLASDLSERWNRGLRAVLMGSLSDKRYWSYLQGEILRSGLDGRLRVILNPSTEEAARLLANARLNVLLSNQATVAGKRQVASELAPITVLEAGSCGTPTLASAFRGVEDVIRAGQTGLVVDSSHWDKVVESATRILRHESEWDALSCGVEQFVRSERTYDRIAGDLYRMLSNVRQAVT